MSAKAEARQLADDELLIVRTFDAPVALVFRIWSQAEHMSRWLGPTEFTCTHCELDFRPGGAWRACIISQAYGESWMGGQYREIEKNRRIVYSFAWDDGHAQPGIETLITVTFAEQDGKTVQTFHQTPFISVEARDSHIGGWSQCFERERTYVETLAREIRP
ncbi:SRPBCC domain-containing protein [Oleomonas cavernae]|uniref:SRPBCC domain-containing protein n=1 Tax=Oleomonas cavernae TaxID=2320859 RepID=A0A418WA06_9PROT|nr:SRPBCC domain-containing protein [Oleomonas cavernae]RJF86845.1 SRPBCC domain-containing protein [Oleomonas cavernae]